MLLKAVFLIIACVVMVNSSIMYESPENRRWTDDMSVEKQSVGNWASQGKKLGLDSSSRSTEDSDELDSSRDLQIRKVQKMYHQTDPEQAGNSRLVNSDSGVPKGFTSYYPDSHVDQFNRIHKDD